MYVTLHLGIMRYVKNFVIFSLIELFSNHNLKETRICIPKSRLVIENLFKKNVLNNKLVFFGGITILETQILISVRPNV
jgi:hypothetical protein